MRFATVLVGPGDAHDIAVEAFLRAGPVAAGDTVANPRAYLMRAVANHANDLRRSRERRWRRDLAAVGPTATASPDTFLDIRRAVCTLCAISAQISRAVDNEPRRALTSVDNGNVRDPSHRCGKGL